MTKKKGLICTMIDPLGPIAWLDNNRIVGRENCGDRNNLMIVEFIDGSELGTRMFVGFDGRIDEMKVLDGKSVKVTSNTDEKTSVIDIESREVTSLDYEESSIERFIRGLAVQSSNILSPDGSMVLWRVGKLNSPDTHLEITMVTFAGDL